MDILIKDAFWNRYVELIRKEMIPFQWNVLNDLEKIHIDKERDDDSIPSEKSHAMDNLRIAAGLKEGHHYGWLFQDSDVYKWLESAANSYALKQEKELKNMMEEVVSLIEAAQDNDGYLSTYYQIEAPDLKFRRLFESHELYCAGHLIEAAVAYFKATGDNRLIKVSEKFVHCIDQAFGQEEGKINGADGHQEIELALVKLYEVTGNQNAVNLSKWFLDVRGQDPDFYQKQIEENDRLGLKQKSRPHINTTYHQAHKPVYEQEEAVGHAVRLVYMAAAMAEVTAIRKDEKLLIASKKLWNNIISKRLYITGGIGSTVHGEAFTFDYDLPNDTMYCETCASIGLLYFARALLNNGIDAEYADMMERTLYNSIISGMALDGKHFFYVNPLDVDPKASSSDPGKSHVKATRPSWFGCACCPPNVARTLTSLNRYIATIHEEIVYIHLYMDMEASLTLNDNKLFIIQRSSLPYGNSAEFTFSNVTDTFTVALRKPKWANDMKVEGPTEAGDLAENGYFYLTIEKDCEITVTFEMEVIEWNAHPSVKANNNKTALQRGPIVYCLEEEDNGDKLHLLTLIEKPTQFKMTDEVLGDYVGLKGKAEKKVVSSEWENHLYRKQQENPKEETEVTFIPYHLWANRSVGEMKVWVDRK